MRRCSAVMRMALGGAACATFVGIFLGGCLGLLWAWCFGDVTAGLDGALLGGGLFCVGGGLSGLLLALYGEQGVRRAQGVEDRDLANRGQDRSHRSTGGDGSPTPSHQEHAPCEV